jgi:eukaryotic-like serine/threonine-protein kinase
MQNMRSMQLFITVGLSFFFFFGGIVQNTQAGFIIYPDDGIWEDTFDNSSSVKLTNCEVKGGEIVLTEEESEISYNFTQKDHEFYVYNPLLYIPFLNWFFPQPQLSKETKLGGNDIYKIKNIDQKYAERSSRGRLFSSVFHHFRFKINIDADAIDYLILGWYGKASVSSTVRFYYYNNSLFSNPKLGGTWAVLDSFSSNGDDYYFPHLISSGILKYAMDENNYIDILVVAYYPFQICSLSTDFIELLARNEKGYSLQYAIAETKTDIVPSNITKGAYYWEFLTWDDYQPSLTEARYHVLYMNATGKFVEVEDTVLPRNKEGFRTSPVYLNNLSNYDYGNKYSKLKIRVNFSTDSPAVSPRIFNWALTWQNKSRWQDSFNTDYRIDQRNKINIENGTLMISSIQDEWPLFGFDTGNTRASGGKGAATNTLYWYSEEPVGGGFRNPVIGNGNIYISSDDRQLHRYQILLPSGAEEGEPRINASSVKFDYDVVNSPALTDDLVIVATGQQKSGGSKNYIYGYEPNNLTKKWEYDYKEKICYDASPVIDGSWLYITTWGGDSDSGVLANPYTNNKLLALNFDSNAVEWRWEFPLPAASYSSPAVTTDKILVACSSTANDSVFAINRATGTKIWSNGVGAVGHASPVVSGDTVFITCRVVSGTIVKKYTTKIVAMNLNDGTILWNVTLGSSVSPSNVADSTPAVYDGVLYVASADGTVYALSAVNGTIRWSKKIYTIPSQGSVLQSSPAYADNHVYIGTPAGKIYALQASTGNPAWEYVTFPNWTAVPVLGSPVVSNGLVFIADEKGYLYSLGRFTTSTKQVTGRIISMPIRLPEALWWDSFYADMSLSSSLSSITFKLLDEKGNLLKELTNKSSLTSGGLMLGRTIRLQADFSASNITQNNPKLFRWYLTLTSDTQDPFLNSSSFTPNPGGWLEAVVPVFTIKVKDNGTGLRVTSGYYTLEYTLDNVTQKSTFPASCTGENGTTAWETLTMDISALSFFANITSLKSIQFNITDLAGNTASKTIAFKQDTNKPTSSIITTGMKNQYTSSSIRINATATDVGILNVNASGIKRVELYYRYSQKTNFSGDWVYFANSTKSSPTWLFNFTNRPSQPGGYFELCTRAIDNANNTEDFPSKGDVMFLYDWKAPSLPSVSGDTLWFNERPSFSVVFEDDFRLDTIQYRPNFDSTWTTLASDINASVYNTGSMGHSWVLPVSYWDQMVEGDIYYLYLRVSDSLGNMVETRDETQAISIRKDVSAPLVAIDVPVVEEDWSMSGNFTVSALINDREGSGIKEALLYYRYSEDNANWSDWEAFGDFLTSDPFEWEFDAIHGDGYYEMKIAVTDYAGNAVESAVFPVAVASFPTVLALILVGLLVVLIILSIIIYLNWRKKQPS